MQWACTNDRQRLTRQDDKLRCAACGNEFDCIGDVPTFAGTADERRSIHTQNALLDELSRLLAELPFREAERRLCERHGCSRHRFTVDWTYFLPVTPEDRVLEIGAGCGEDTLLLAGRAAHVISLVPTVQNAEILSHRLREERIANVSVAVLRDLSRLPIDDGSVAAVAIDGAAGCGFRLAQEDLEPVSAEWSRVLAPGGTAFVGLRNSVPGLERVRKALGGARGPDSLNRRVKSAANGGPVRRLARGSVTTAMRRHGFRGPTTLAPLPDESRIEIVLPIDHGDVVRYCFGRLLRRNSPINRLAIRLVNAGARLNVVSRIVPYYFLVFETASA